MTQPERDQEFLPREKEPYCNHYFEVGQIVMEANPENPVYHRVGYAICHKCGEMRKQDI